MRKLLVPLAAVAVLATVGAAAAAERTSAITAVNAKAGTISLADGKTLKVGRTVDLAGVLPGWVYNIDVENGKGGPVATDVELVIPHNDRN